MKKMILVLTALFVISSSAMAANKGAAAPAAPAAPAAAASGGTEKSMNVRVNPLGLLFGSVNGKLDMKMNTNWTVGLYGSYASYSLLSITTKSYGVGVGATYYFNKAFEDSWVVEPFVAYNRTSVTTTDTASLNGFVLGSDFGYQWNWAGGFNITLGLGVAYTLVDSTVTIGGTSVSVGGSGIGPSATFALGYAF